MCFDAKSQIFIVDEKGRFSFKYTNRFLRSKQVKNWLIQGAWVAQ